MSDECSLNPGGYIFHRMPQNILAPYKWKNVKPTSYYSWLFSVVLGWKNKLFLTLGLNLQHLITFLRNVDLDSFFFFMSSSRVSCILRLI